MGEMCDFEAEFYPENWHQPYGRNGKTRRSKVVTMTLSPELHRKFKAIGGVLAVRKLIEHAAEPREDAPAK